MTRLRLTTAIAAAALAGSCAPRQEAPPARPADAPPPERILQPPPPSSPPAIDWQDMPLTAGSWFYSRAGSGSQALFGPSAGDARFAVRCESGTRRISLVRGGGATGGQMTVRTSFAARSFPATVEREPLAATSVSLAAADPFLDSMVFSRGRFTVEVPGLPMLIVPAWPEAARVVEDCRS